MIIKTPAIVLRSMDYRETSQIVTLFTREQGKVSVIAKGSRAAKSTFGSTLQPMACIQAVYYFKENRDLQTLTEANHLSVLNRLRSRLDKIGTGIQLIERVDLLTQPGETHAMLFDLLHQTLLWVDTAEERTENLFPYFLMQIAGLLGFEPVMSRETIEQIESNQCLFSLENGDIQPAGTPMPHAMSLSRTAARALAVLALASPDTVVRMRLEPAVRAEIDRLVDAYLHFHVQDQFPPRATHVIESLAPDPGKKSRQDP